MKVALCLHGLFDSLTDKSSKGHDGYEHIKKNILDGVDTDVYIHSWDLDKQEEILNLYNPKSFKFDNQIDFTDTIINNKLNTLKAPPRSPQTVLSHLYSVGESVKLAFESLIDYDIVIKARFDLGRINRNTSGPGRGNPFPVQCINFKTNIQADKLYMANWQHFHMGPADMWFYGSLEIMKPFTTLFKSVEANMKLNSEFHQFASKIENNPDDLSNAIAFYKWWMIKNKLWDNRINLNTTWE